MGQASSLPDEVHVLSGPVYYSLCVLGGLGVGKTALIVQLCSNVFIERDDVDGQVYRKNVAIDDQTCVLEVLDSAGQDEQAAAREELIQVADGVVLVYSIASRASFERVARYWEQVVRVHRIPMMLVANKCDLEEKREVSTQEGADLARAFGALFVEASAKTRVNVEEAFYDVVRLCRRRRDALTPK